MFRYFVCFLAFLSMSAAEPELIHIFTPGKHPGWKFEGTHLVTKQTSTGMELCTSEFCRSHLVYPVTLSPGRSYRIRLQGTGPLDLFFRRDHADAFYDLEVRDVFRKSPIFEAVFTPDAESPAGGRFILRPAERNVPVTLERFELKPLGGEPPSLPEDRVRRLIRPPAAGRGVVFSDGMLTEDRAKAVAAGHGNLVRLRFQGSDAIGNVRKACRLARRYGVKITLEFMHGGDSLAGSSALADLFQEYRDVIWAVRPGGQVIPENLAKFRVRFPDMWIMRELSACIPAEIVYDQRTIYCCNISTREELRSLRSLLAYFRVPVLATVPSAMADAAERALVNWVIAVRPPELNKELEKLERLLAKNASAEDQEASIVRAVQRARSRDSLVFGLITDTHYRRNSPKDAKAPAWCYAAALPQARRMAGLAKKMKADFIAVTGDILDGPGDSRAAEKDLAGMMTAMASACIPVLGTRGDHDRFPADADFHRIVTLPALKAGAKGDPDRPESTYYSMDFPKRRIRVIVLDTGGSMTAEGGPDAGIHQVQYLAKTGLDFRDKPDGRSWSVLLLGHAPASCDTMLNHEALNGVLAAFLTGGKYAGTLYPADTGSVCGRVSCDFSAQGPMRILGMCHGNFHEMRRWEKVVHKGAFREYLFPCAFPEPGAAATRPREKDTPEAGSFSFVVLDPVKKTLKIFRCGAGFDESYSL